MSDLVRQSSHIALTVAVAIAAAAFATWLSLPSAPLIGATAVFTLATLAGWKPTIPVWLRNAGFTVIGVTLGASVTPRFIADLARFPATIVALTITMAVVMVVTAFLLRRMIGIDRPVSMLATSPGALSVTLALALERPGATPVVMSLQTLRLVLITLVLPPLIALTGPAVVVTTSDAAYLAYWMTGLLLAASALAGHGLTRLGLPAAYLIAGLLVSGLAHFADIAQGSPPVPVTFTGLALAGAVIGSRFSGVTRATLARLAIAGLVTTSVAIAISAAFAYATAWLTGFPFAQVWIAFAPGGVEGMAAMAISLGHDPAFVATHHIFRIMALIIILPLLVRGR